MTSQPLNQKETSIDIVDASKHLHNLIEMALSGKEIVITRDNHPLVKLVSISPTKPRRQFGSARGLVTLSDDFDQSLEDFNDYIQ